MKIVKHLNTEYTGKHDRKHQILLGAVDYYIKTGKPVGSNTLQSEGFDFLSSATIRNYFASLEETGFLTQTHASGGRIPTTAGFKVYALEYLNVTPTSKQSSKFNHIAHQETKELVSFLQHASNLLSDLTRTAVFLSSPKFDQDYIMDIKLVPIDYHRCLAVIITDFGVVQTEILHTTKKLSSFSTKRIEAYFHFRLNGRKSPENLNEEEEELALKFYNELMVRYIVGYTNFTDKEIIRTGFSKLLTYPDFQNTTLLANSLALFENVHSMRLLLKECTKQNKMKFWIGDDLTTYTTKTQGSAVIAIPYAINNKSVGAIGLLGPSRMPYRKLFQLLREFSDTLSQTLTRNIYKYKISFRQPEKESLDFKNEGSHLIEHPHLMLLENQIQES